MKKTTLKWHLSEKEKPTEDDYYLVTNDIDSVFMYQTMYYSTFYGKFNCGGGTDEYALYPKYWAEIVPREKEKRISLDKEESTKTIFNSIDEMMDCFNENFSPTTLIKTLLKMGIISESDFNVFMSYIDTKFYTYLEHLRKDIEQH